MANITKYDWKLANQDAIEISPDTGMPSLAKFVVPGKDLKDIFPRDKDLQMIKPELLNDNTLYVQFGYENGHAQVQNIGYSISIYEDFDGDKLVKASDQTKAFFEQAIEQALGRSRETPSKDSQYLDLAERLANLPADTQTGQQKAQTRTHAVTR